MTLLPIAFASPWILLALATLPVIWWLLRLTPPKPREEAFPPTRLLSQIPKQEETPAHSPWWLVLLRLAMAALVILAMAGPIWNPQKPVVSGNGPLLVIFDNSWASGASWPAQIATANRIIDQANADERPVSLLFAVGENAANQIGISAVQAKKSLQAAVPQPVMTDWSKTIKILRNLPKAANPTSIVWLSSGLQNTDDLLLSKLLKEQSATDFQIYLPNIGQLAAITNATNDPSAMEITVTRPQSTQNLSGEIIAFDEQGRSLATTPYTFDEGATSAKALFKLPVELRNDIARIDISGKTNAGGVYLLDEKFQRRRVGLISGENSDLAQPLLSPLYYISRALGPYSELRYPDDANISNAAKSLIADRVSTLIMADIGTISPDTAATISKWVEKGGMLIRFAGPRLAASASNALIPVLLRNGGRNLAGSLTWGTPQPLTSFSPQSPFADLNIPDDVTVSRQVLAEPNANLPQSTWASLADGTPLVTAAKHGNGWVVLFHVTANASWSNLALSGSFVEMLRRVVRLSGSAVSDKSISANGAKETVLPPFKTLNGKGQLENPPSNAKPLVLRSGKPNIASYDNPPGQYGSADGFVVQNLMNASSKIVPIEPENLNGKPVSLPYIADAAKKLRPWLLASALLLLALDCLAVIWMAGLFSRKINKPSIALIFLGLIIFVPPNQGFAQNSGTAITGFEATLSTRLAYVITGNSEVDEISRQGLIGLTAYIHSRTSLEPGPPVGLDISKDELSFYPLIYWPVDPEATIPDANSMARIDAFMKKGGTVIFDTKDALSGGFGGATVSRATEKLRKMLAGLDIPPLERVPSDHVLTKAFYLLKVFPGRFNGDTLWVEASEPETDNERPVRVGDGVSSIIITSNDFAGAWAIDEQGRPLLPTVPSSPILRTYAYRVGVNLAMYTLTGNYKSDQVHIPALLERLGQ